MYDEVLRLRSDEHLLRLLEHYVTVGATDRERWQDRVMALAGVEGKELTRLHGELLACDWIEQNTGITPWHKPGVVAGCYRTTAAGRRALRLALKQGYLDPDDVAAEAA